MEDLGSERGSNLSSNNLNKEEVNENSGNNKCPSWYSKFNITIEPAVCAIFLSANLCDVVITNLILLRVCESELSFNKTECSKLQSYTDEGRRLEALVQPYASVIITGKSLITSIIPAVLSLFLGPWSDYNGRKFLLMCPMIGLSMTLLVYAALAYFSQLRPEFFLLASLPFSFFGGYINLVSAAYSYITDVSSEQNRALRLGIFEASIYIGVLIGVSSSYKVFTLDKQYGGIITLSIGALISLVAFLYTIFFIPESVTHIRVYRDESNLFQMKFIKEIFVTSFKRRENYGRVIICLGLFAMVTNVIGMEGEFNLMYLFTRLRFGWEFPEYTKWSAVFTASHFVGILIGCVILTKVFRLPDIMLVILSYLVKLTECLMYGFVPKNTPSLMYWAQLVGCLGGVSGPAVRSVISKVVPKEDVGKVFFLASSLESVFPLAIVPIYTVIYNSTMKTMPGAFFLLSAFFYFIDFISSCVIYFVERSVSRMSFSLMPETE